MGRSYIWDGVAEPWFFFEELRNGFRAVCRQLLAVAMGSVLFVFCVQTVRTDTAST